MTGSSLALALFDRPFCPLAGKPPRSAAPRRRFPPLDSPLLGAPPILGIPKGGNQLRPRWLAVARRLMRPPAGGRRLTTDPRSPEGAGRSALARGFLCGSLPLTFWIAPGPSDRRGAPRLLDHRAGFRVTAAAVPLQPHRAARQAIQAAPFSAIASWAAVLAVQGSLSPDLPPWTAPVRRRPIPVYEKRGLLIGRSFDAPPAPISRARPTQTGRKLDLPRYTQ